MRFGLEILLRKSNKLIMKVIYISELHGHTSALADTLYNRLGKNFIFIDDGNEKKQYGGAKVASSAVYKYRNRQYVIRLNETTNTIDETKQLINEADVVLAGGEPFELVRDRILANKLTFRLGERSMKGPLWKDILRVAKLKAHYDRYSQPNYRKLSLSGYDANDMRLCNKSYRDKCYNFAYFNQIQPIDIEYLLHDKKNDKLTILWCARFIGWKHPELPILLAKKLVESGRDQFEIQMIGSSTTPLWHTTKRLVERLHLSRYVKLTGALPNTEVLERMRKSNIFLFTSDKGEGWGVVLNEAMCSGCACVVSHEIGSVPTLIKNNENGLIFKSRSTDSLFKKVTQLYDDPKLCIQYGRNAYKTITEEWSVQHAVDRLIQLADSILAGNEISFAYGPCSKARPINPNTLII